jgi:hypothetical protein
MKKPKAKIARPAAKRKPAPTVIMKSAEGIDIEEGTNDGLKLTPKQETFCQAYIETGIGAEAFRRAYDTSNWTDKSIHEKASQMLSAVKIRSRVNKLKAAHRERHEITVDDLVAELEEARSMATKIENPSAMVSASLGKGKLLGLVVEKRELTGKNGEPLNPVRELTDVESARRIAFILGRALRRQKEDAGEGDEDDHVNGVDFNGAYAHAEPDEPVRTFDPTGSRLD